LLSILPLDGGLPQGRNDCSLTTELSMPRQVWNLEFEIPDKLSDLFPDMSGEKLIIFPARGTAREPISNESLILAQNQRWRRA
jgi:hypothetical protein